MVTLLSAAKTVVFFKASLSFFIHEVGDCGFNSTDGKGSLRLRLSCSEEIFPSVSEMVLFVLVNGSLAPLDEVGRLIGLQLDLYKKQQFEGTFELFCELNVGRVVFWSVIFDDKP
jgi:hypothetical protein